MVVNVVDFSRNLIFVSSSFCIYRQTVRQTDRQSDRQTDTRTHKNSHNCKQEASHYAQSPACGKPQARAALKGPQLYSKGRYWRARCCGYLHCGEPQCRTFPCALYHHCVNSDLAFIPIKLLAFSKTLSIYIYRERDRDINIYI